MNCWLDSHCHINDAAFKDDLPQVLERMVENDVRKAMIISSYIEDYEYGLKISHPDISFIHSLGIYPGDADDVDEELFAQFADFFAQDECKAIGEIGIDYHWGRENRERQLAVFERQLLIAKQLNKPVIIHSRDGDEDTYELLKKYPLKGVMHCYGYDSEQVRKYLDLGFYISIAGVLTWKKADKLEAVVRNVPLDRLLIETDCPYLTPAPLRGKRNEPSFVVYTGRKICEILELNEDTFKLQLNENYQRLFKL